jgi:preprotein translocase subunit SecE
MAGISENSTARGSLLTELFSGSVYKRSQGRIARQLTFVALAMIIGIGVWRLAQLLAVLAGGAAGLGGGADFGVLRYALPLGLLLLGLWIAYRIVNVPWFADFLIAVEAEMAKVSWPSGDEVFRSSAVIIFLIFALAAILAAYDLFWWFVLRNVLRIG